MEFTMSMSRTFWLVLPMILMAAGQDTNYGIKVKCFVKDGTVLCPGCNSRAGLTCPRNLKTQSCNIKTDIPFPPKETNPTEVYQISVETTTVQETTEPSQTTTTTDFETDTYPDNVTQKEIDWAELAKDLEFRLFVYHILRPYQKSGRWRRDATSEDVDDSCEWNGDCPCPLICCKTGDGCPKRCMSGIRLPPPWG